MGARQLVVQLALEMMLCLVDVELVVIDTDDHRDVLTLGRSGDDDLLGARRRCGPWPCRLR